MDTTSSSKRRVWVVEIDDSEGQGIRSWLAPDGDDTGGQGGRWYLTPEGDDTAGQGIRGNFASPDGDDTEGHGVRGGWLRRSEDGDYLMEVESEDDLSGQGYKVHGLGKTEEDVEGQGWRWNGLVQFIRPVEDDDVAGQGIKFGG